LSSDGPTAAPVPVSLLPAVPVFLSLSQAAPYVPRSDSAVKSTFRATSCESLSLTYDTTRDAEIALDAALAHLFSSLGCVSLILAAPLVPLSSLVPIPSTKGREQPLRSACGLVVLIGLSLLLPTK